MKKLLPVIFLFICNFIFAQHETDKWYFGANAGIDFTGGTATPISNSAMNVSEGCASIADTNGNLLFYTDGITVWNNADQPMPNGNGLNGGISSQAALIVPLPGNPATFYIFTNDAVSGTNGLQYSVVDMTLDSGRGDVSIKNVFIRDSVTEKLTAVVNHQSDGYWIAAHEFGTDTFCIYRLTSTGFDSIPVLSKAGKPHSNSQIQNAYGQMKFSPCGDRLAVAIGYLDTIEVFNFDDATGTVSLFGSASLPDHVFGIEFSPDGKKVYVSTYAPATLYQFDLSSGSITNPTALSISPDTYSLQLANDGKIYVVKSFSPWLGAITDPNISGPSCNYVDTALFLDPLSLGHSAALGLPGFVQSFFRTPGLCSTTGVVEITSMQEIIYPNPTSDDFKISITSESLIEIHDIDGSQIDKENATAGVVSIGSGLRAGIYIIHIRDSAGERNYKAIKF